MTVHSTEITKFLPKDALYRLFLRVDLRHQLSLVLRNNLITKDLSGNKIIKYGNYRFSYNSSPKKFFSRVQVS